MDNDICLRGRLSGLHAGQAWTKKIKDWLEINWYKYSDINWRTFGKHEANFYMKIVEKTFGRKFLSFKRFTSVLAVAIALLLFASLIKEPNSGQMQQVALKSHIIRILLSSMALSISITVTYAMGKILIGLWTEKLILNILIFSTFIVSNVAFLSAWHPVASTVFDVSADYIAIELPMFPGSKRNSYGYDETTPIFKNTLEVQQQTSKYYVFASIDEKIRIIRSFFGMPVSEIFSGYIKSEFDRFVGSFRSCRENFCEKFIYNTIFYIGYILRVITAIAFLASVIFEWALRKPIFTIWARLVESEKPPFTVLFTGASAFAVTIESIRKHFGW